MSALLLDTHALLWWMDDDPRLGAEARRQIAGGDVFFSIASLWEIAIKHSLGKIEITPEPVVLEAEGNGFGLLQIVPLHCSALASLPWHHRDPFDRMLVAQARSERLGVVTADPRLRAYDVTIVPCG